MAFNSGLLLLLGLELWTYQLGESRHSFKILAGTQGLKRRYNSRQINSASVRGTVSRRKLGASRRVPFLFCTICGMRVAAEHIKC